MRKVDTIIRKSRSRKNPRIRAMKPFATHRYFAVRKMDESCASKQDEIGTRPFRTESRALGNRHCFIFLRVCTQIASQCSKATFTSISVHISAVCILPQEVCQHGRNKGVTVTDPVQSNNSGIK